MSIYTMTNHGTCIIVDGVAYHFTQTVSKEQSADPTITTDNIESLTFSRDDDNSDTGTNHNQYTACEVAVAKINTYNHLETLSFTATENGILRLWTPTGSTTTIYKNGTQFAVMGYGTATTFIFSHAVRVTTNDVITASGPNSSQYINSNFLPYSY